MILLHSSGKGIKAFSKSTDFVIRRRIPEILATVGEHEADDALLEALTFERFEVRYRAGVALAKRRRLLLATSRRPWQEQVWHAISLELRRGRSLWELNKLLDNFEVPDDDLATVQVGIRGERSLEHTFRLLTLVLDPQQIRAAYHGILLGDGDLKSFALEYLELVLPSSVRHHLWLAIGDASEQRLAKQLRSVDAVVEDLMDTRQTLFGGEDTRLALRKILEQRAGKPEEDSV